MYLAKWDPFPFEIKNPVFGVLTSRSLMKWKFCSHGEYKTKENISNTLVLAIEYLINTTIVIVANTILYS